MEPGGEEENKPEDVTKFDVPVVENSKRRFFRKTSAADKVPDPSRRRLLKKAAIAGGALIVPGALATLGKNLLFPDASPKPADSGNPSEEPQRPTSNQNMESPRPAEPPPSPEVLPTNSTEYGFNTHVYLKPKEEEALTLERFKESVDLLKQNNQEWLRFNIWDWETAPSGTPDVINWDEKHLALFDQVVNYATEKGLKIDLTTNVPLFAKDYPPEDYKKVTKNYYEFLSKRYKGKIKTWQIFNEPNIHNFRDYGFKLNQLTSPSYVQELAENVAIANRAIKKHDPRASTTVNLSHYIGHGADIKVEGSRLFDPLAPHIDKLTLDLYPDDNEAEIGRYGEYVDYFVEKYKKGVIIGELGYPTTGGKRFSEVNQAKYVSMALDELKSGLHKPELILLYQLINETTQEPPFNDFGFIYADGKPKKAFNEVITRMQPEVPKPKTDTKTG